MKIGARRRLQHRLHQVRGRLRYLLNRRATW